jgi:hypothetical protein
MYGLSLALDGDLIDLIPSSPKRLEVNRRSYSVVRSAQLAEMFLPTFSGLTVEDTVSIHKNSAAAAEVRASLSRLLDAPPDELTTDESVAWVRDMVEAELRPRLANLRRELGARPTNDVVVSAGIAVGAALAEFEITGSLGVGTGVAAAASGLPLAAQWISRRRELMDRRVARRVMVNAIASNSEPETRWELRVTSPHESEETATHLHSSMASRLIAAWRKRNGGRRRHDPPRHTP